MSLESVERKESYHNHFFDFEQESTAEEGLYSIQGIHPSLFKYYIILCFAELR